MEESVLICPSCGKQNPANARFCYACGATLSAGVMPSQQGEAAPPPEPGEAFSAAETQISDMSYSRPQAQYVPPPPPVYPPAPQAYPPAPQASPPATQVPPPAPTLQSYPPAGYPPAYPPPVEPPKPARRGRVRCCAVGCLVVLLVLLIGLPVLHVTVLRPLIEREIFNRVSKSLEDVTSDTGNYYGTDTETLTERQINDDAKDSWDYIPGSSDGHIFLQQDQIKFEVKVYGVKVWAAADLRVNNRGEFVLKSVKMHWLLNVLFSEAALKREIADYANEKIVRPKGLTLLAFQVSEGRLFVAYESR